MRQAVIVTLSLATVLTGCRIKETKDENGKTKIEAEPAKVEVGTDTATVKVPTVQIAPDTAKHDTTHTH